MSCHFEDVRETKELDTKQRIADRTLIGARAWSTAAGHDTQQAAEERMVGCGSAEQAMTRIKQLKREHWHRTSRRRNELRSGSTCNQVLYRICDLNGHLRCHRSMY